MSPCKPCPVIPLLRNSRWRPKPGSSFIFARVVVFEGYLSWLLCHYCYLNHKSSCCHISRWRQKSTTTVLNLRSSTCKRSKRYVQNWKYFRFVVAILTDWFAVNSNSIYPACVSFPHPLKLTITVLHHFDVSNFCRSKTTSAFCLPYLFPVWRRHLVMRILLPLKRSSLKT